MKSRMKKIISMGLAAAMIMSLAACGQEGNKEVSKQSSESKVESSVAESSSAVQESSVEVDPYEATEYPESVSVFMGLIASKIKEGEEDYNASASFRLMEELTGTHIEWKLQDDYDQKFQLALVSRKFDDVIIGNWKTMAGGAEQAAKDGVILNLSDYAEYMPNFMEFTRNNPDIAKEYLSADGQIYYLPYIRKDKELSISQGMLMRTDWLDKLGLDVPTDAESLYNVLVAFKTQDPNGNGEADEIPMSSKGIRTKLLGMFGTADSFYLDDGKVMYGPMTENYSDALEYLAKLYAEGLYDEEYVMLDRSNFLGKVTNNQVGMGWDYQPSAIHRTMVEKGDTTFQFVGIPWLENDEGVSVSVNAADIQRTTAACAAITTSCENPEAVLKWLDTFYSEEAIEIMNYGEEGVTFEKVNGEYVYTDYITNNPDPDKSLDVMLDLEIASINGHFPELQAWGAYKQKLTKEGMASIETWATADKSMILPSLTFTAEENEKITNIMSQVSTLVSEKFDKIIMGQESIDVLDDVRATITKMGIEEVLSIYQTAYERYNTIILAE